MTEPRPTPVASRPAHVPALDGLRGVAILMVVMAHVFGMPGGVFGVDLFFVLSGFLITRLLLADSRAETGYFRRFYIRRILRIAPPYYVTLAIVLIVAASLRVHWWVFVFYLADFPLSPSPVLGHTWSLAIEEQFYLVWPFVIRRLASSKVLVVCVACLLVSVGVRLALPHWADTAEHARYLFSYGLLSRTDGLFVGASIAILARSARDRLDAWSSTALMIAVAVVAGLAFTHHFSLAGMSPAMAIAGIPSVAIAFGAVLWKAVSAPNDSLLGAALAFPPLRRLGRVSYTVYLAHVPMLVLFETHHVAASLGRFGSRITAVVVAYVIAEVSWRVLEQRIARLKDRWI